MRPWTLFAVVAVPFVMVTAVANLFGEDAKPPVPEAITAKFAKLDRNGDKRLSVAEYRASVGAA